MKQKGASCRILLRCGLLILTLGILMCGAVRSFGESEPPGNAFDMEEQLIIPTNKTQITLRTGPGFFYPVKQTLTECEKLEVLEKGLWYKVQYEGTSGYVYSALFVDEEGFAANRLDGAYIGIDFAASYNAHSIGLGTQVNIALANLLKAALEEGAPLLLCRALISEAKSCRATLSERKSSTNMTATLSIISIRGRNQARRCPVRIFV